MTTTSRKRSIAQDMTTDNPRPTKLNVNDFARYSKLSNDEPRAIDGGSAVCRVLNVPEILEDILLYMDFKTLLLAQRTSTHFLNTIDGSVKLQKKLFKKPVSSFEEAEALDMITPNDIILLPVYEDILPDGRMIVNPHILAPELGAGDPRGSRVLLFTLTIQDILASREAPEGRLGSRAQMYVIQPAITDDVELVLCSSGSEEDPRPVTKNISLPSQRMTFEEIIGVARHARLEGHVVLWRRTWLYAGRYYKTYEQYIRQKSWQTWQEDESLCEPGMGCICVGFAQDSHSIEDAEVDWRVDEDGNGSEDEDSTEYKDED